LRCLVIIAFLLAPALAYADTYHMLIGSEPRSFDHPPIVRSAGRSWLSGQTVGLNDADKRFSAEERLAGGSATYVSYDAARREGYRLSYNPLHNLLQLAGRIERVEYDTARGSLQVRSNVPVTVAGVQNADDKSLLELTIDGGWLADSAPRDYPGDRLATRLSFKTQPELGRSFIFVRQPERLGYSIGMTKVGTRPQVPTDWTVKLGNYLDLTDLRKSASGEIALTLRAGARTEPVPQLLSGPTRLVVDFPGTQLDGAARSYKAQGRATSVRLEAGPNGARLTVGMSSKLDWRLLPSDGGAKQQLQLLPLSGGAGAAPASRRSGRAILIDAGHGGSDPGAVGVVGGVYEKTLNTQICARLKGELTRLGYTVLETRTDDRFVSLGARADYANLLLPWLLVSVHCNKIQSDIEGVITFVHPDAGSGSRKAAALIHSEFLAATGAVDKKVRDEDFFVLRETVIPSVLVECGFMSHTEECGRLCDPAYQQKIAAGIAKGIDRFVLEQ
jgi:N-acetylmuramoyl-L-alanine amidase